MKASGAHAPLGEEYLQRFLARPDNILIVAEDDGGPVGFLLAYALDRVDRDQKMVCLYEIEVASAHRRRGVGAALVEEHKEYCRRDRVTKAWVVTNRSNGAAVRLYESTGARAATETDDVVFVYEPAERPSSESSVG